MSDKKKIEGLGDAIKVVLVRGGVKKVVDKITTLVGIDDCGCEARAKKLNEKFPFKNKK